MERCPCCSARLNAVIHCLRCQADLSSVLGSKQHARLCLHQAVQCWFAGEVQQAMQRLTHSLRLHQTADALVLRDFICQKQMQRVMGLMAQEQWFEALQLLNVLLELHSRHALLNQMRAFAVFKQTISNNRPYGLKTL